MYRFAAATCTGVRALPVAAKLTSKVLLDTPVELEDEVEFTSAATISFTQYSWLDESIEHTASLRGLTT